MIIFGTILKKCSPGSGRRFLSDYEREEPGRRSKHMPAKRSNYQPPPEYMEAYLADIAANPSKRVTPPLFENYLRITKVAQRGDTTKQFDDDSLNALKAVLGPAKSQLFEKQELERRKLYTVMCVECDRLRLLFERDMLRVCDAFSAHRDVSTKDLLIITNHRF